MCFSMRKKIDKMKKDQRLAQQCYLTIIKEKKSVEALPIDDGLDQREEESRREPAEQLVSVPLNDEDSTKIIQVRSSLNNKL